MPHEFDGKKYAQASAHQKEWGNKLIAELGLKGSERVLDLGCGDGVLTAQIADLVPKGEVVGIDASRGMIEAAQPKARKNLRFVLMDINTLDFADEFDVVFSNATLHWVKDHKRLLANVGRAMRPGGRLRFNFGGEGNCANFLAVAREAMAAKEFAPLFAKFDWPWYMPSVKEYTALVATSGFKDACVWLENADRSFPNAEALIKWIDQPSIVPFLSHLPEKARSPFRAFVVERMLEKTQQPDSTCFEIFRRINVSACK
ncbi:MAG: methyltransferase domain-containing protein [Planctomycetota bacterium]